MDHEIEVFLSLARRKLSRRNARMWAIRGVGLAGLAATLAELVLRRWPAEESFPPLLLAVGIGAAGGLAGWQRSRPSLLSVARKADWRMGGSARLATALEWTQRQDAMALSQRRDAARWARRADPSHVLAPPARWEAALVLGLAGLAFLLSRLHNPALARLRERAEVSRALSRAAASLGALPSRGASRATAGEGKIRAVLAAAVREVRTAGDLSRGMAAMSRAQSRLEEFSGEAVSSRRDAAIAAGEALARVARRGAGEAMLGGKFSEAADQINAVSQSLPSMSSEGRAAASSDLRLAAEAAAPHDPALARSLSQASSALRTGDIEASKQALAGVARQLSDLAGDVGAASEAALLANRIQDVKEAMLAELGRTGGAGSRRPEESGAAGSKAAPRPSLPRAGGKGAGGEGGSGASGAGAGSSKGNDSGTGGGQGGSSAGKGGAGSLGSGGAGPGQAAGEGSGTGTGRSGSGSGGGTGQAGEGPGLPGEKVFIPAGGIEGLESSSGQEAGVPGAVLPYERFLAGYREAGLEQMDRELIPESLRALVHDYFQE